MKSSFVFILLITVAVVVSAQNLEIPGTVEVPAPPETLEIELEFKGINVFEYDLDLIFMNEDSNEEKNS